MGDCKAAAIKLCHELGKGSDCDAPVTSALEYSLKAISEWGMRSGSVKVKDRPVKLQVCLEALKGWHDGCIFITQLAVRCR